MNAQTEPPITEQEAAGIAESLLGLWKAGGTLAQAMGLSAQECEAMYAYGHALYAQGKYDDAFKVFARLVAYDHMDSRYQLALACALQMTGRHEEALQHYMIVTVMRLDDPVPVFHCAECLLALGRPAEAAESLVLVIDTLCKAGEHDAIRARAEALLGALRAKAPVQ
ncbi:SycD/LcrH family type III secretion system chaperone [Castellaniella defragrans]|uniref:Type III secretion system low calcium response chaperone LcrH/SycD n=1 Tax=Castellaniella defragrans TaxID=75697 RepID=A0A7W9TS32_CASDE|nr:SycD/LcrH family type III secretion system chaperone [Castellaniella defragrans]MBB6084958.1 type III secretion system low calcium response chaperone LcrH/SycD [Castellaniella defragrans]